MNSEFQSVRTGARLGSPAVHREAAPLTSPYKSTELSVRARLGLPTSSGPAAPPIAPQSARSASASVLPPRTSSSLDASRGSLAFSPAARSRQLQGGATPVPPSPASSYFDRLKEETAAGTSRSAYPGPPNPTPGPVPPPHAAVANAVPVAAYLNEVDALRRTLSESSREWNSTNSLVTREKDALLAYSKNLESKNKSLKQELAVTRACAVLKKAATRRLYSSFTTLRDATVDSAMSNAFSLLDSERKKTATLHAQVRVNRGGGRVSRRPPDTGTRAGDGCFPTLPYF